MRCARRRPPAPPILAALLLGGCLDASAPVAGRFSKVPPLASTYVLATVSGRALPARFVQYSQNVYRVHADTLRFDLADTTFVEVALIGGRDTTSAEPERVAARTAGPLPFEQTDLATVVLSNHLGLGRTTATIQDGGLTIVSLGQRFVYLQVFP
jgi:hypothetical protein